MCLQHSRNPDHFFEAAVCLLKGLGQFGKFIACHARANELRHEENRELGVADLPYRVLNNFWSAHFGHTAEMAYVVKLGILEGRKAQDTILYLPVGSTIANPFMLEQWRPFITFVERAEDLPFPQKAVDHLQFAYLAPRLGNGTTVHYWELAARTVRRWHAEKRPPLLNLAPEVEERGRQMLARAGMPRDAWFVTLHVRENGSNPLFQDVLTALNADIQSYVPAINEITRRGGWVIRMGDPSMAKLPTMPHVIDYCHSDLRADWMDVFIAAKCRFFLGTASGPAYVPPAYGVAMVLTNWWPPSQRPWQPTDIFVPKRLRSISGSRNLSISESLSEPYGYCTSAEYLAKAHGVIIEDNDPEDIRLAVVEMFELIDGSAVYSEHDLMLRRQAERLYETGRSYGMANIARDFLRRHEFLLK
jgi:putative glycosyltransferase (TIGR04372 family)